jgi:hypothetical protein
MTKVRGAVARLRTRLKCYLFSQHSLRRRSEGSLLVLYLNTCVISINNLYEYLSNIFKTFVCFSLLKVRRRLAFFAVAINVFSFRKLYMVELFRETSNDPSCLKKTAEHFNKFTWFLDERH